MGMSELKIENNQSENRFEALVNGRLAVLDYQIQESTMFLLYVAVPAEEQGRGVASDLARAALEFARDSGFKVVPRCPFISAYMRRHPELLKAVR